MLPVPEGDLARALTMSGPSSLRLALAFDLLTVSGAEMSPAWAEPPRPTPSGSIWIQADLRLVPAGDQPSVRRPVEQIAAPFRAVVAV